MLESLRFCKFILQLKKFLVEQEEAYEIKIGDQLFRRPGDPPFEEVFQIEEEKSRHSEL